MIMLGRNAQVGMSLRFVNYIPEQVKFASTATPEHLNTNDVYIIDEVKRGDWYTKIRLKGDDLWYNSVHFRIT